jgi:hypothetical protein
VAGPDRVGVGEDGDRAEAPGQDQLGQVAGGERGPGREIRQRVRRERVLHTLGEDELGSLGPEQAGGVVLDRAEAAALDRAVHRRPDAPDADGVAGGMVVDAGDDAAGGAAPPRAGGMPAQPVIIPDGDPAAAGQVVERQPVRDGLGLPPQLLRPLAAALGLGIGRRVRRRRFWRRWSSMARPAAQVSLGAGGTPPGAAVAGPGGAAVVDQHRQRRVAPPMLARGAARAGGAMLAGAVRSQMNAVVGESFRQATTAIRSSASVRGRAGRAIVFGHGRASRRAGGATAARAPEAHQNLDRQGRQPPVLADFLGRQLAGQDPGVRPLVARRIAAEATAGLDQDLVQGEGRRVFIGRHAAPSRAARPSQALRGDRCPKAADDKTGPEG